MKKQIIEEINQIQNLQERVVFKDLMNGVFLSLYEYNQQMYQQLENRLIHELSGKISSYGVVTGLVERRVFDEAHHIFSPMLEEDGQAPIYDLSQIQRCMKEQETCFLTRVFFQCDRKRIQALLEEKPEFYGKIITDEGEIGAVFRLQQSDAYLNEIYRLYQLFIKNGIPWKTINAPYIFKMLDIYLERCEGEINGEIKEIIVEFREYQKDVSYDRIPVWNIKKIKRNGMGFPVPCEDHKNYEHLVPIENKDEDAAYLVSNDIPIQQVQVLEDRLVITAQISEIQKWEVYLINSRKERKTDFFSYPLMSNRTIQTFSGSFQQSRGVQVKSKAELIRFLRQYEASEYLELESFMLIPKRKYQLKETYSMNPFLIDEIRNGDYETCFILRFHAVSGDAYLWRDLMSFLVSEVQFLYPEYQCEGVLL